MENNLIGKSLGELQALCEAEGMPKYAARQMSDWLYAKNVGDIDAMTNLSLKTRAILKGKYTIVRRPPVDCQVSVDGTKKYIFEVACQSVAGSTAQTCPAGLVETVFIPDGDRATLCVSSQVGCRMGCRFCVTGSGGFHGNLPAAEILNQIFSVPEFPQLTNIVYMGMGEPFDNYEAVMRSIEVLTSGWGLAWSPHRITVSSVGHLAGVERFVRESPCRLAISLHTPYADERAEIMPMQRKYPLADVVRLLKQYDWTGQRRLSFEYIMFGALNDDLKHADALVQLLKPLPCRVNLIRFHNSPGMPFRTSERENMQKFADYLCNRGLRCTIRASRGEDIMAACGLLAGTKKTTAQLSKSPHCGPDLPACPPAGLITNH